MEGAADGMFERWTHPWRDSSLLLATRPVACDLTMAAFTSIRPGRKKMMNDCGKGAHRVRAASNHSSGALRA